MYIYIITTFIPTSVCRIPKTHSVGVAEKNLGSPRISWPIRSTSTVGGVVGSRATRDGVVAWTIQACCYISVQKPAFANPNANSLQWV